MYGCFVVGLFWVVGESEGGEVVDGGGEEDCVGLSASFPPFSLRELARADRMIFFWTDNPASCRIKPAAMSQA